MYANVKISLLSSLRIHFKMRKVRKNRVFFPIIKPKDSKLCVSLIKCFILISFLYD